MNGVEEAFGRARGTCDARARSAMARGASLVASTHIDVGRRSNVLGLRGERPLSFIPRVLPGHERARTQDEELLAGRERLVGDDALSRPQLGQLPASMSDLARIGGP